LKSQFPTTRTPRGPDGDSLRQAIQAQRRSTFGRSPDKPVESAVYGAIDGLGAMSNIDHPAQDPT